MFVTIHRLFSLPVSLPVRGADGLAKRALYGGIERQRLSSQSVKAHLRANTGLGETMGNLAASLGLDLSVRSALIGERLLTPGLKERGVPEDEAKLWSSTIMALFQSGKQKEPKPTKAAKKKGKAAEVESDPEEMIDAAEPQDTASDAGRQILVLGKSEVEALATLAMTARDAAIKPAGLRDLVAKPSKAKGTPQSLQDALAALAAIRTHAGFDGALFGRMATGIAVSRVDSAVHVGHALTVHPIQSSVDFFSAQDELLDRDAGETGGAHIGSRELTTGVYYLPVVIDLRQLRKNLAELEDEQLGKIVSWLVRAVATVTPAAMLGSTAPYTDPGEVVVAIGRSQPISMMAAFECPVTPTLDAAKAAFEVHAMRVWAMVGRPDAVLRLSELIDLHASTSAVQRLAEGVMRALPSTPAEPALAAE